jgi:transcriptional accessory protein Tex/SPT6
MKLDGVVRNVTDFGAFVDIWLHSDGLVHKSQLADRFVSHPSDVVSVGMQVQVTVLEIDKEREKVSLGMKTWQQLPSISQTPRSTHAAPQSSSPAEKAPDTWIKNGIVWG